MLWQISGADAVGWGFYLLDRNLRRFSPEYLVLLLVLVLGRGLRVELTFVAVSGWRHGHANARPRTRTRTWLQQQPSARAHPSTRIFPKKYAT